MASREIVNRPFWLTISVLRRKLSSSARALGDEEGADTFLSQEMALTRPEGGRSLARQRQSTWEACCLSLSRPDALLEFCPAMRERGGKEKPVGYRVKRSERVILTVAAGLAPWWHILHVPLRSAT